jgi:hypothetical protein
MTQRIDPITLRRLVETRIREWNVKSPGSWIYDVHELEEDYKESLNKHSDEVYGWSDPKMVEARVSQIMSNAEAGLDHG